MLESVASHGKAGEVGAGGGGGALIHGVVR